MVGVQDHRQALPEGATVAIVGGGPAGSFAAIHILKHAQEHGQQLRVVVFERRRQLPLGQHARQPASYSGCPQCAGGISPRLNEALAALDITVPPEVTQASITSITVQGNWKHIHLPVPSDRKMLSVYRGALPFGQQLHHDSFDSLLLDTATSRGAELIGGRVTSVGYDREFRPLLHYRSDGVEAELTADFVVFAGGVNERTDLSPGRLAVTDLFRMLQPRYQPPGLRKALIFELEAPELHRAASQGELHFIESSVDQLHLDMCSIMPKRDYFTVTLIGKSIDQCCTHKNNLQVIREFLALPQIRQTLPPEIQLRISCICNPSIVVGSADVPFAHRAAAVGDMATSRQYKDGILSAHDMARDLARVIFDCGTDIGSLRQGYGATLARFDRDNRYATLIFTLYRWFFTSPFLSRVIYQTYASERKSRQQSQRSFERIFWAISSGDQSYEKIAWSMVSPATLWRILSGGVYVTIRNGLAEYLFGLDWRGIGRFPTAVSVEQQEAKRWDVLEGRQCEFECIYTINVRAGDSAVRLLLAELGESDRRFLNPRWVGIQRVSAEPLSVGTIIRYQVFGGLITFNIEQQESADENMIKYRVNGGFADGGTFLFQVTPESEHRCSLTVYLAFDYPCGDSFAMRVFWRAFRLLFPEYIHDVIWNHALCEIKQLAERVDMESEPELIELKQL